MSASQTPGAGAWIAGLLFFAGLAAGPGYWIYSKTYSGKMMGSHEIRQARGGLQPMTVALSPDMNPIGMAITADYFYASLRDTHAFISVALYDGKTRLAQGTATFETDKKDEQQPKHAQITIGPTQSSKTVFLETFTVPRAGDYTFQFTGRAAETAAQRLGNVQIKDARLELRRNMKPANMKIVWAGVGVLVFSLLLGWMTAPAKLND